MIRALYTYCRLGVMVIIKDAILPFKCVHVTSIKALLLYFYMYQGVKLNSIC
jgi:hypothetical protein